jgi:hypothetical protein
MVRLDWLFASAPFIRLTSGVNCSWKFGGHT